MLAPSTALVSLSAQGQLLVANVASPITINLTNANGSPVPDGTEVWLTASRGALDQAKARTRDGKVAVTFMPPAQSGIVKISASSGDVQGSVEFAVASAPVGRIALTGEPASLPSGGGQVDVVATVLSTGGQAVSGAPVSFGTNTGSLTPTTAVVSDGNGHARAKLTASAASVVRANIFDQFGVELAVPLQVQVSLTVTADPAGPTVGQDVVFTITLKGTGAGAASISFGDGQSKELGPVTMPATLKATHEYSAAGGFNVTATVQTSPAAIRETIRVEVSPGAGPSPPPPSPPVAGPSPPPPSPPGSPDDDVPFDLSDVTWLHTDVSDWRQTSTITRVRIDDPPICIDHTKSGRWPVRNGVEGNPWIFARINGRWYAATYEWLKPGQTCKGISAATIGPHTKQSPMDSWRPRSGELVGFMVSALARFGQESVAERSNIVMVRWP